MADMLLFFSGDYNDGILQVAPRSERLLIQRLYSEHRYIGHAILRRNQSSVGDNRSRRPAHRPDLVRLRPRGAIRLSTAEIAGACRDLPPVRGHTGQRKGEDDDPLRQRQEGQHPVPVHWKRHQVMGYGRKWPQGYEAIYRTVSG